MKLKYSLFIISLFVCIPQYRGAMAVCNVGEHLMTTKCRDCPAGCYCTDRSTPLDPENAISNEEKAAWCARTTASCSHIGKDGYGDCGKPDGGVNRCPDEFPKSDAKSISIEQCYAEIGSGKLFYKQITCAEGRYLPVNSDQCARCKEGKYCPGVSNIYPSIKENQGLFDKTDNISVSPGKFLPANKISSVNCTGTNKYCPGGVFNKSNKEQGRYDCPKGAVVNDTKTFCTMTLTETQMKKCWIYLDSQDYLNCMGISVANNTPYGTSAGTQGKNDTKDGTYVPIAKENNLGTVEPLTPLKNQQKTVGIFNNELNKLN